MIRRVAFPVIVPILLVPAVAGAQLEWNPFLEEAPRPAREERRDYTRGLRKEVGRVARIEGRGWLVRPGVSPGEAERRRALRVGDGLLLDSLVETDAGSVLELVMGHNLRLRLEASSRLRFVGYEVEPRAGALWTLRRVRLEAGAFRARVRENTRTPSPLVVLSQGNEFHLGWPGFFAPGGVDCFCRRDDTTGGTRLAVLGGRVVVSRPNPLVRRRDERVYAAPERLEVPAAESGPVRTEPLAPEGVREVRRSYAFSNERWNAPPVVPERVHAGQAGP